MKRYLILDRDGTIIVERGYLGDPDGVELVTGAGQALKAATDAGWGLIVASNQSGVGRGFFTTDAMDRVNQRMSELLEKFDVQLGGIYTCTEHPDLATDDRKPGIGMVVRATRELQFDPKESVVVGDKDADILLARNLSATAVLVLTGCGKGATITPDFTLDSIADLMTVLKAV